ncbi:MAG: hypothetical protein U9P14_01950, partial [Gemmatimonadota bacterium]|nr:hypothetical protein [Gemmatimonadota bacterium]
MFYYPVHPVNPVKKRKRGGVFSASIQPLKPVITSDRIYKINWIDFIILSILLILSKKRKRGGVFSASIQPLKPVITSDRIYKINWIDFIILSILLIL